MRHPLVICVFVALATFSCKKKDDHRTKVGGGRCPSTHPVHYFYATSGAAAESFEERHHPIEDKVAAANAAKDGCIAEPDRSTTISYCCAK
jgi:hypothetical protein